MYKKLRNRNSCYWIQPCLIRKVPNVIFVWRVYKLKSWRTLANFYFKRQNNQKKNDEKKEKKTFDVRKQN